MLSILPPAENVLKILGRPKKTQQGWRLMKYCIQYPISGGTLFFHVLTRELLFLTEAECADLTQVDGLKERWFLVPSQTDDRSLADTVRFVRNLMRPRDAAITSYTVFPTTDCNARCFYCYELGRSRIPMDADTARKAADYMLRRCQGKPITIKWFGGEPLFNRAAIDTICAELRRNGQEFSSTVISNGYLFDWETVQTAVRDWHLKRVQISMDGTEETYNRRKAFIYSDGSAYRKVLENIGHLLDAQVRVSVRLNMEQKNARELSELVDELAAHFPGKQNLSVYLHTLFEAAGYRESPCTEQERTERYRAQMALEEKLTALGLGPVRRLRRTLPANQCMADSGNALTILPGGQVGLCEHFSETEFVGTLESDALDPVVSESFRKVCEPLPECADCCFYPECIRLKKCAEQALCFPQLRQERLYRCQKAMENEYHLFLRGETLEQEEPELC